MSKVMDWISELIDMYSRHAPDIDHKDCKELADLLQERLDIAEELYNINRHLSIALMNNQGISAHSVERLNLHLAGLIKKLRGE